MSPWISGASFQDDFAGLPGLVTSVTRAWLLQPGNSPIAARFDRERGAAAGQKIELPGANEAAVLQLVLSKAG